MYIWAIYHTIPNNKVLIFFQLSTKLHLHFFFSIISMHLYCNQVNYSDILNDSRTIYFLSVETIYFLYTVFAGMIT